MPRRRALTLAQLEGLLALPTAEPDLVRHWILDQADLAAVDRCRGTTTGSASCCSSAPAAIRVASYGQGRPSPSRRCASWPRGSVRTPPPWPTTPGGPRLGASSSMPYATLSASGCSAQSTAGD